MLSASLNKTFSSFLFYTTKQNQAPCLLLFANKRLIVWTARQTVCVLHEPTGMDCSPICFCFTWTYWHGLLANLFVFHMNLLAWTARQSVFVSHEPTGMDCLPNCLCFTWTYWHGLLAKLFGCVSHEPTGMDCLSNCLCFAWTYWHGLLAKLLGCISNEHLLYIPHHPSLVVYTWYTSPLGFKSDSNLALPVLFI